MEARQIVPASPAGSYRATVERVLPLLTVGAALCAALQAIFWLPVGASGRGPLFFPFLLAYSQKAMLDHATYEPSPLLTGLLWTSAYVALAFVFALMFGSPGKPKGLWTRALTVWILAEGALALAAWMLFERGLLYME